MESEGSSRRAGRWTSTCFWNGGRVKLVADGAHALPEGIADTMALISDTDAYQQFVQAVRSSEPEAIDNAILDTLSDPDVVVPTDAAGMVGAKWLAPPGATGTIRVGLITGQYLALEEGGVGTYVDTAPALDTGATWVIVGRAAAVVLDTPRQTDLQYRDGVNVRRSTASSAWTHVWSMRRQWPTSGRHLHYVVSYPTTRSTPTSHREPAACFPIARGWRKSVPHGRFPAVRTLQLHR